MAQRRSMVEAVRGGRAMRGVAREYGVSLSVVQHWVSRAGSQRLDRVEWEDHPSGPRVPVRKVSREIEERILELRRHLRTESDLGEYGAQAIHRELAAVGGAPVPSVRTIGRVLDRGGAWDGRRRRRWPSPPRGWYLPGPGGAQAEVDSFDIIEGLHFRGGQPVEVLTGVSLHGGLVAAWPEDGVTAKHAVAALIEHWRDHGRPAFAPFDNDTVFQGSHHHADTMGRVSRLCLSLGVTPVFAPVQEPGFQAAIENFNGRWQAKVWARFRFPGFPELKAPSDRFVAAGRLRSAPRRDAAPDRWPVPPDWRLDLQAPPSGVMIFVRRTNQAGVASLLGHKFKIAEHWPHRLVRSEVDLDHHRIRFFALRRREPTHQPLLAEVTYVCLATKKISRLT